VFPSFLNRNTGDVLVILIALTICTVILFTVVAVAVIEIIDPATDTDSVVAILSDVINTLIGVMAGFLAGRTDANRTIAQAASEE
jgi:hypothetical protein